MEILIYTLNNPRKFWRYHTHLKDPWQFLGVSLGGNTSKVEHNLKNIPKYCKNSLTNKFLKTSTCILKNKGKFGLCHTCFTDLWWFFGWCLLNIEINLAYATSFSERCNNFWMVLGVEKLLKVHKTSKIFANLRSAA